MHNDELSKQEAQVSDEIEIDLVALLLRLRRYWWALILGLTVGVLLSGIYTFQFTKPMYQATSMVYVRGAQSATIASLQDLQIGAALTKDYEIIFKSRTILEKVIDQIGLDMDYKTLASKITITNPNDSRILQVTIKDGNAELARDMVNTLVEFGMDNVREIDAKEPYLIDAAVTDMTKVSPSVKTNLLIGGLLGLMVVAGGIFLQFILSNRICSAEDVERALGVPVLCMVADSEAYSYDKYKKGKRKRRWAK